MVRLGGGATHQNIPAPLLMDNPDLDHCSTLIFIEILCSFKFDKMVYKRKSTRGWYGVESVDILKLAIEKVRSGEMSKRKAEQLNRVPRRTLTRHLKGNVERPGCRSLGRFRPTLSQNFESGVERHAITLQQRLFGFSTRDCIDGETSRVTSAARLFVVSQTKYF